MTRISISQNQGKIPDQFKNQPVPDVIRSVIATVDSKHSLSPVEIEWILKSLDEQLQFTASRPVNESLRSMLETACDIIFTWIRKIKNQNILLNLSFQKAYDAARADRIEREFDQAFSQHPEIVKALSFARENTKSGYIKLNGMVEGGLSVTEFRWILKHVPLEGYSIDSEQLRSQLATVIKWSRATGTQLSTINDRGTAIVLASEWADYDRKARLSKRLSSNGLRTVPLSGKWKAVWIDPDAMVEPEPVQDNTIVIPRGPSATSEVSIEAEITGISTRSSDRLISIRDANGVSQASLSIIDDNPDHIDVYEVEGTTQSKDKIRELAAKLKQSGVKMWWVENESEISGIRDLEEAVHDVYGFIPSIRLHNIGVVGDRESYKGTLEWIYNQAVSGSRYYDSIANDGIEALANYAEQRNELHLFQQAEEDLGEWAMNSWADAEMNLRDADLIKARPDEEDEEFNPNGEFDQEAFNLAEAEYNESVARYEEEHEPNQFLNAAYKAFTTRRNKPENKAFYDKIDHDEEVARQKAEQARLEAERIRNETHLDNLSRKFHPSLIQNDQAVPVDFSDDDNLFASSLNVVKTAQSSSDDKINRLKQAIAELQPFYYRDLTFSISKTSRTSHDKNPWTISYVRTTSVDGSPVSHERSYPTFLIASTTLAKLFKQYLDVNQPITDESLEIVIPEVVVSHGDYEYYISYAQASSSVYAIRRRRTEHDDQIQTLPGILFSDRRDAGEYLESKGLLIDFSSMPDIPEVVEKPLKSFPNPSTNFPINFIDDNESPFA